jgi:uncharacterized protein YggE
MPRTVQMNPSRRTGQAFPRRSLSVGPRPDPAIGRCAAASDDGAAHRIAASSATGAGKSAKGFALRLQQSREETEPKRALARLTTSAAAHVPPSRPEESSPMSRSVTISVTPMTVRWAAVALGVGIVALALISASGGPRNALAVEPNLPEEHTISVTGVGRVMLAPDTADVRLGVIVQRPTATEARAAAATAMTGVIDVIRKAGIADKDIQTAMLSLQPVYDYNKQSNPPPLVGFQVVNTLNIVVRDLSKVGDLIDDAIGAGATSVDGVSFRVENPTAAEAQARKAAVEDARTKANALASAAGVSIVGVSAISEQSGPVPYPIPYERAAVAADGAGTPVQPGQAEISVSVSVIYRIG